MSKNDVECPVCGTMNRYLDLEKTDGWMECEHCGNIVQLMKYARTQRIRCYQAQDCHLLIPLPKKKS